MALTAAQQKRLEERFRREFLALKRGIISDVITDYTAAINYIADVYLELGIPRNPTEMRRTFQILAATFADTYNFIERSFQSGIITVNEYAVNNVQVLTELSGVQMTNATVAQLLTLPNINATAQLTTPIFSDGLTLSDRVWRLSTQADILGIVKTDIVNGEVPTATARKIEEYASVGNGYKNGFRLAYTEMNYAYSKTKVDGARVWNDSPGAEFELAVHQYLSASHRIYDICDVYAGTYRLDQKIPACPRHALCNCGEELIIVDKYNRKQLTTPARRLAALNTNDLTDSQLNTITRAQKHVAFY